MTARSTAASVFVFGLLAIVLGFAMLVRTAYAGGGTIGYVLGAMFIVLGTRASLPAAQAPDGTQASAAATSSRRARARLGRVRRDRLLDLLRARRDRAARARASRRSSSASSGCSSSSSRSRTPRGRRRFARPAAPRRSSRVAFNDLAGFLTGWVLFLDYLIVIALSALFVPHYLGLALGIDAIARRPGDVIAACGVVVADRAASGCSRRTRLYSFGIAVPILDLVTQVLLVDLRLRDPLLRQRAHAGPLARHAPELARHRVRAPARDARVHRPRDRRELRRGSAAARPRPAAQPVQRDHAGRRDLRADRARRPVRLSVRHRNDRARHGLAARAADGDRRRAASCTCRTGSARSCASTSA